MSNSSRWVREKWNIRFAWQTGDVAFSVSESNVPAVSRYIAGHEEHHKKRTFQEEFVAFMKKNNNGMSGISRRPVQAVHSRSATFELTGSNVPERRSEEHTSELQSP